MFGVIADPTESLLLQYNHGETDYRMDGLISGQLSIPLNNVGREQAREWGLDFNNKCESRGVVTPEIFTSPSERCEETCLILGASAENHTLIREDERLRDPNWGNWEGKSTRDYLIKRLDDDPYQLFADLVNNVHKGESLLFFANRMWDLAGYYEGIFKREHLVTICTHRAVRIGLTHCLTGYDLKLLGPLVDSIEPIELVRQEIKLTRPQILGPRISVLADIGVATSSSDIRDVEDEMSKAARSV